MRKVEQEMIEAIRNSMEFKKGNTCVEVHDDPRKVPDSWIRSKTARVYLHCNLIAEINLAHGDIGVQDAGWQSVTTKSRINAILQELIPASWGVVQRGGIWYLQDCRRGVIFKTIQWQGCATFSGEKLMESEE